MGWKSYEVEELWGGTSNESFESYEEEKEASYDEEKEESCEVEKSDEEEGVRSGGGEW